MISNSFFLLGLSVHKTANNSIATKAGFKNVVKINDGFFRGGGGGET
jgi:hypothetical protein